MDENIFREAALALKQDWALDVEDTISEQAILSMLAARVIKILEKGPDAFYQLMYRLDISEKKLNAVLGDKDVADKIARLIYDRQLQKIESRRTNKKKNDWVDGDLGW